MTTGITPANDRAKTFFFMDMLRAYACFMLILFHAHSISRQIPQTDGTEIWPSPVWWCSAIDLFFVMSGFLIIYMGKKLYRTPDGVKIFAIRRAVRILPLYWIYTFIIASVFLLGAGTSHTSEHVTIDRFMASLLFWPIQGGPIIPLGWTLNFEVFFYILFSFSLRFAFLQGAIGLCGVLGVLAALGVICDFQIYALKFWTEPLVIDFIFGLALGIAYHLGVKLPNAARLLLAAASVLPLLAVPPDFTPFDIVRPFTFGASAALLVAAACLREKEYTFGKAGAFLQELSNSTYSLYLSHIITLKAVELVYKKSGLALSFGPIPYIIFAPLCAVVVGYIAYISLEKPLTGYLRSKIPNT